MSNIELQRDHCGGINLVVSGYHALGAQVTSMQQIGDELSAVVLIPLKHATFAGAATVVPFVRPEAKVA